MSAAASGADHDRRLLRRAAAVSSAALVGKAFWPLLLVLAPRWHGAEALGQFLLVFVIAELALALGSTGFVDGVLRAVARAPGAPLGEREHVAVRAALVAVLGLGGAALAVAWLGGGALLALGWGRPELHGALCWAVAIVPLGGATAVLVAARTATMANGVEHGIKSLLVPGAMLALAWASRGSADGAAALARSYAGAQLIGLIAAAASFSQLGSWRALLGARAVSAPPWRATWAFGLTQGASMALWVSIYSVDLLLLAAYAGDRQVALYRAGSELARVVQYLRTQFSSAYAPLAARYLRTGERGLLAARLREHTMATATWALAAAGALAALAGPVLDAVDEVGSAPSHGAGLVAILLVGHWAVAACALAGNTLVLAGRVRQVVWSNAAMVVVHLAIGWPLVAWHGAWGAAAATSAAMALAMALQARTLTRELGLALPWRALARLVGVGAMASVVAWLVPPLGAPHGGWATALLSALGFCLVVAALGWRPQRSAS